MRPWRIIAALGGLLLLLTLVLIGVQWYRHQLLLQTIDRIRTVLTASAPPGLGSGGVVPRLKFTRRCWDTMYLSKSSRQVITLTVREPFWMKWYDHRGPLSMWARLEAVEVKGLRVMDDLADALAELPPYRSLNAYDAELSPTAMERMRLTHVTRVSVHGGPAKDIIRSLACWPRLQHLSVRCKEPLSDEDLAIAATMSGLQSLHCPLSEHATPDGIAALQRLPALTTLTFWGGINDAHLDGLLRLQQVHALKILKSRLTQAGIEQLVRHTTVRDLSVDTSQPIPADWSGVPRSSTLVAYKVRPTPAPTPGTP